MAVDTADVQGLVVSAYSHLRAARILLLHFLDRERARAWLRGLVGDVTTAASGTATARDAPALNIAFTCEGLRFLGVGEPLLAGFSIEFQEGMDTPHRARLLGDEGPSAREQWIWGRARDADPDKVHAIVLLYDRADVSDVYARRRPDPETAREVEPIETRFLVRDPGDEKATFEHFGFHDGLSGPTLAFGPDGGGTRSGESPLKTGEFLLGHENEYGQTAPGPSHAGVDLGYNGSYLVVRQLSQDVHGFWQFVDEASREIGMSREELAAKMVGRRLDGRPLVDEQGGDKQFGFADDPTGVKCPLGAHVRRANPRDWIPGQEKVPALEMTKKHRLLRRGRPYGEPAHDEWDIDAIVRGEGSRAARGLLFMCLNADIARQFEFVQSNWIMSPKFGELERDADPLVGPRPRTMTIRLEDGRHRLRGLPRFVELRGGAYFFLPGMKALHWLAEAGSAPTPNPDR